MEPHDDNDIEIYESTDTDHEQSEPKTGRNFWKIDKNFKTNIKSDYPDQGNLTPILTCQPIVYFRKYLTDEILSNLTTCTNQRGIVAGKQINVTEIEMQNFSGMNLLMSIIKFPWIRLYWDRRHGYDSMAKVMTRDRFFLLRNHLKITDDNAITSEEKKTDRLWKVRPILNAVRNRCMELPR